MTDPVVIPFKRGATFSFMMMIPEYIDDGFMSVYIPTAQLRRKANDQVNGLIADLSCYWADPGVNRYVCFYYQITTDWPLGRAEMDVKFASAQGEKIYSTTTYIDILREITK
jgi:hypothetical protein